jgi:mannose-6-phosphate isomerase
MTANRLASRQVEKMWGRQCLPQAFGAPSVHDEPVGEIWFEDRRGGEAELLVKYLLTSEALSIQVHPGDDSARARGLPRGKDEAWLVVEAEAGARIGLGPKRGLSREELRSAALGGGIEALLDWREARAGDFLYAPGGTIHALGPGLTLIEIQQNLDLTWRLYDYRRGRPLQVEEAVAAACLKPYRAPFEAFEAAPGRQILAAGGAFVVERWNRSAGGCLAGSPVRPVWLIVVRGGGLIDGHPLDPGSVWLVEDQSRVRIEERSEILFAYPGGGIIETLFADTRSADRSPPAGERRGYRPAVRLAASFR